jgi:hypothetical protein
VRLWNALVRLKASILGQEADYAREVAGKFVGTHMLHTKMRAGELSYGTTSGLSIPYRESSSRSKLRSGWTA